VKGRCLVGGNAHTRILVADNDARVRSALQTLLRQEPGGVIVRESANVDGLAMQVKEFKPDLVLLDWELPGRPAAALLFALHGLGCSPKVIVLSARPEAEGLALSAGANAFVCKGDPPDRLLDSFRSLVQESRAEGGKRGSSGRKG
jgi:DNA-binding NarL/FixJ family response regulator